MFREKLRDQSEDEGWKEDFKELSLSQTEVKRVSNLSVVYRELKILENVPIVLDLFPSIIDYAVNFGLKETSDQCTRYLKANGWLSSDVNIESVLSRSGLNFEIRM